MIIKVNVENGKYDVIIEKNSLQKIDEYINSLYNYDKNVIENKKFLIVTDENIPKEYADIIKSKLKNVFVKILPQGETTKSLECYGEVMKCLLQNNFTRQDVIIALGGGVIGDLSAFVASTYMRGIDFINIPTSFLSQVDSSVGGKTGINFDGVKNVVGTFYQPKLVIVDIDLLKSLELRQISNGIAESIKMGFIFDENLIDDIKSLDTSELFECSDKTTKYNSKKFIETNENILDKIISKSIDLKRKVIELDYNEKNVRRSLNFGHTIGHGIESYFGNKTYLHGECVALGMIYMTSISIKERLITVLKKMNLKTHIDFDIDKVLEIVAHDKKKNGDKIKTIFCDKIGHYVEKEFTLNEIRKIIISDMEN